ncbi:hypothetical protein Mapa_007115 [Marchantia paleacea]|nr:hypothetical protein Mapa_007115 [Marchantia paleacea]
MNHHCHSTDICRVFVQNHSHYCSLKVTKIYCRPTAARPLSSCELLETACGLPRVLASIYIYSPKSTPQLINHLLHSIVFRTPFASSRTLQASISES